jgi:hypothetical protein
MWHSGINDCKCEIVNKLINNLNGVFSGKTRIIGVQNWSSTPNIVQYSSDTRVSKSLNVEMVFFTKLSVHSLYINLYFSYIYMELGQLSRYSNGQRVGRPGFDSRQCKNFLFSTASRPALEPNHLSTQRVPGALSFRVRWQGCEADQSASTSAEVKNNGAIHPLPHTSRGIVLN